MPPIFGEQLLSVDLYLVFLVLLFNLSSTVSSVFDENISFLDNKVLFYNFIYFYYVKKYVFSFFNKKINILFFNNFFLKIFDRLLKKQDFINLIYRKFLSLHVNFIDRCYS